jgi:hypothetical protein
LRGVIQGLALSRTNSYRQAYGSLKKLKILLPGIDYGRDGVNFAGISILIQSVPLLEELELEVEMCGTETVPDDFFQSLILPNLQLLTLDFIRLESPAGLIRFFRNHMSTLRKVDFGSLLLETGSWETVVTEMKELRNLSSVKWDSVDESEWDDRQFGPDTGIALPLLEDYILGKTDTNPFDLRRQVSPQYHFIYLA